MQFLGIERNNKKDKKIKNFYFEVFGLIFEMLDIVLQSFIDWFLVNRCASCYVGVYGICEVGEEC